MKRVTTMKQLLMIIPFFPPMAGGGVYRPLSFVKYLGRYGWQTTVIAPRGDAFWIQDERLTEQIPESCEVVRTDTLSGQALLARLRGGSGGTSGKGSPQKRSSGKFSAARWLASFFLIPDTYVGWRPYASRAALELLSNRPYDAIYSTSPPETSHLVALDLHDRTGLPWVADFRDPWMNLYLLKPPTPVHAAIHRKLERRVCNRAHVVVTTEWHEEEIRRNYPGAPGVTRIPNGYDAAEAAAVEALTPGSDRLRITHAGMLTQNRTAVPFLRGLHRFLSNNAESRADIEVLFVGAREDRNEAAVRELELEDVVEFHDSRPHDETLQLERRSHILLLIKHVNPDYRGMVPGKLYEYIGLRRPILALSPDGEASRLVEGLRRGLLAPQENEAAIASALESLYQKYRDGALETGFDLSPRPEFARESLAGNLARLLDDLAGAA
ncbi:MAG: glycosyltransferase [Candidatus Krumholzibacteria bacterium]|nr:glycosyltransferase [Candidatus Krumholzibacteria bacterium]